MRARTHKFFGWLTLDMIVFLALNAVLIAKIIGSSRVSALSDLSFLKLFILGLAAYRAANILSNEPVTKPLRTPFVDETKVHGKVVEKPKKSGFTGFFGTLIYCPSCTGVWLAAALVYFYIFWPAQTLIVALFLALSAIERIIARILGWYKK
ncbi:MAG: DUF1360 domain-containing protein [Candidatus Doudnabacteria bacterium]